ncbi:hypothetical protein N7528_008382 [Penicillium herquei]|nr:hypothetical protein N7528_008382 [Penicillium herquei]
MRPGQPRSARGTGSKATKKVYFSSLDQWMIRSSHHRYAGMKILPNPSAGSFDESPIPGASLDRLRISRSTPCHAELDLELGPVSEQSGLHNAITPDGIPRME